MTTTDPAAPAPAPAEMTARRRFWLSAALLAVALFETVDGLSNVGTLFGDMSEIPGPGFGGFLIKLYLATHPIFAIAALIFAAFGRVRFAVMALIGVIIGRWLWIMPSVAMQGLEMTNFNSAQNSVALVIAPPLLAACALALTIRNERLGFATLLVCLPSLYMIVSVFAFAIGVAIYGF